MSQPSIEKAKHHTVANWQDLESHSSFQTVVMKVQRASLTLGSME